MHVNIVYSFDWIIYEQDLSTIAQNFNDYFLFANFLIADFFGDIMIILVLLLDIYLLKKINEKIDFQCVKLI